MAESKFFPKLTQAEAGGVLTSMTASEKFISVTTALARKLTRMDDEAAEAMNAIKNDVTSTTIPTENENLPPFHFYPRPLREERGSLDGLFSFFLLFFLLFHTSRALFLLGTERFC